MRAAAMSAKYKKMGEQRPCMLLLYVCYVFLCMVFASVDARLMERDAAEMLVHCVHERNEQVGILSGSL